jgi:hypothetical protein
MREKAPPATEDQRRAGSLGGIFLKGEKKKRGIQTGCNENSDPKIQP